MYGSDEEIDDQPEVGSDEDFSDDVDKHVHDEVEFKFSYSFKRFTRLKCLYK